MIIQFIKGDVRIALVDGVNDYETGKHHSTFVTATGILEMKTGSYDYFTVQLEESDMDEAVSEHKPSSLKKKRIGFLDDETEQDEGGEPLEPAIGDVIEDEDWEDEDWEDDDYE